MFAHNKPGSVQTPLERTAMQPTYRAFARALGRSRFRVGQFPLSPNLTRDSGSLSIARWSKDAAYVDNYLKNFNRLKEEVSNPPNKPSESAPQDDVVKEKSVGNWKETAVVGKGSVDGLSKNQPRRGGIQRVHGKVIVEKVLKTSGSFRVLQMRGIDGDFGGGGGAFKAQGRFKVMGEGQELLVWGEWTDSQYGRRLRIFESSLCGKFDEEDLVMVEELKHIKGVGDVVAQSIVETLQKETREALDSDTDVAIRQLMSVKNIGVKKATHVKNGWDELQEKRALARTLREQYGCDHATAKKLVELDGVNELLEEDPYVTLMKVNNRLSFEKIDEIAGRVRVEDKRDLDSRVWAAIVYVLKVARVNDGHTYLPWGVTRTEVAKLVMRDGGVVEDCYERIEQCARSLIGLNVEHNRLDIDALHSEAWDFSLVVEGAPVLKGDAQWNDDLQCYLKVCHDEENAIASGITRLLENGPGFWSGKIKMDKWTSAIESRHNTDLGIRQLSQGQLEALHAVLEEKVVVITGGPGSGKTHALRSIVGLLLHVNKAGFKRNPWSYEPVQVAAPTGRAASHLGSKMHVEVKTIHRMLEYRPKSGLDNGNGNSGNSEDPLEVDWEDEMHFGKNGRHQLSARYLIIDEASMIGAGLFSALLNAIRHERTTLVIVGDPEQLPPVGEGAVLLDIIESKKVRVIDLRKIFRHENDNTQIPDRANEVLHGDVPDFKKVEFREFEDMVTKKGGRNHMDCDAVWIDVSDHEEGEKDVQEMVLRCVNAIPNALERVQVLTCSKNGEIGTCELNKNLQGILNPADGEVNKPELTVDMRDHPATNLRTGDRVIHCVNDHKHRVYNGDLGVVTAVSRAGVDVSYKDQDENVKQLSYSFNALKRKLQPAWALTVHKAQGAEYPIVVLPMHPGKSNNTREMFYTAITRAKGLLVVVGSKEAMGECVQTRATRYSGIKDKLRASANYADLEDKEKSTFF